MEPIPPRHPVMGAAAGRPPIIGLVGGIGAGKSSVAACLARLGSLVVDADRVGHELLRRPCIREAVLATWPSVAGADGGVDRLALGRIVFRDDGERTQYDRLMSLVAPQLRQQLAEQLRTAVAQTPPPPAVVLDAALLFEYGLDDWCDAVVYVDAPLEQRLARVSHRGWSAQELQRREAYQKTAQFKLERATHRIDNSQDIDHIARQVSELLHRIHGMP